MTDDIRPASETDNSPITEDCLCVNCGHNLHGLRPSDECPFCHEPVATTLELAVDEVLCMACMKPNPTIAPRCIHCGAALTTSGSVADLEAGKPPMPSVLLKSDNTIEERLVHARSRMWIGLVFFGPMTLMMLPLVKFTLQTILFEPRELMAHPISFVVSLGILVLFCALIWLHYFLINRFFNLKSQLAELKLNPSTSDSDEPK